MTRTFALFSLILLHACGGYNLANDLPAVREDSTPESHAELVRVVSNALNGIEVMLAEDVLTKSSRLVIERKPRRNLQGRIGSGRIMEPPEQFRLVINGSRCELVRLVDDAHYVLKETSCRQL